MEHKVVTEKGMRGYVNKLFDCIEDILLNQSLSEIQKVILLYAWNKPDGYKFWVKELKKILSCSDNARRAALKGLKEMGLAELVVESKGTEIERHWEIRFDIDKQMNIINNKKDKSISPSLQSPYDGTPSHGKDADIVINNTNNISPQLVDISNTSPSHGKVNDGKNVDFIQPIVKNIPNEMKKRKQWVYWKAEVKYGKEKPTKIPYLNKTTHAKINDPTTWQEMGKIENWQEIGMTGIGFVLSDNDPYTIIDLDKCIIDGQWNEFAKKTVKAFDSYTELSPSGTGLHIIVKGKIDKAVKTDKIEIYYTKRYMAMTGVVLLDKPIMERQKKLDYSLLKLRPKSKKNNYLSPRSNGNGKFTMPKETFPEGQRNNSLASWAGILRTKNFNENEYFGWLKEINQKCCSPPLSEEEVMSIGNSIKRY